jgi:hypothetical protein
MGPWEAAIVLAWAAIGFLALAMYGLSRQLVQLARQATPQVRQRQAPVPILPRQLMGHDDDVLLGIFVDESCPMCRDRLNDLAQGRVQRRGVDIMVLAEARSADRVPIPLPARLALLDQPLAELKVPATPYGIVVVNDSIVDAAPIGSSEAFQSLLDSAESAQLKLRARSPKEEESWR